ncbi:VWA domain-containing protein, partial [Vibrio sinaloensis]|uniref:VWA domain-containing protein n=1 Tax=Photobacterium sp. (strain ATCC 43367) TaxID=379097 RepID=UPI000691937F
IPAGITDIAVSIPTTDDTVHEGNETFGLVVTESNGVTTNGSAIGNATIVDNDVTIKVHDALPVNEGEQAQFKVELSEASPSKQFVKFEATTNGYDTESDDIDSNTLVYEYKDASGDFQVANVVDGFVEIPAGVTELRVTVQTIQDDKFEWTEKFGLHIIETKPETGSSAVIDVSKSDLIGVGTIKLDNGDNPTLTLSNATPVDEGNTAVFEATLSNVSEASIDMKVEFVFSNGSGEANLSDLATDSSKPYAGVTVTYVESGVVKTLVVDEVDGTFTLPAKVTDFKVNVDTVNDDRFENSEDFEIKLSEVPFQSSTDSSQDVIINHGQVGVTASGTIKEDLSDKPTIRVDDAATVTEGQNLVFAVTVTGDFDVDTTFAVNFPASLDVNLAQVSFTNGVTLSADGKSIIVPVGVTAFDVIIPTIDDKVAEATENYTIQVGGDSGTGTILDNEVAPVITDKSVFVSEEGLTGGITDDSGLTSDTTNAASVTGSLVITDANSDLSDTVFSNTDGVIVVLDSNGSPVESGGVALTWEVSDNGHTLIGSASGQTIVEATLDNSGGYDITLHGQIDHPNTGGEDTVSIDIPVIANDASGLSSNGKISLTVEDDQPVAKHESVDVDAQAIGTNVQLVLDTSGSMDWLVQGGTQTRLDVLVKSLKGMLAQYAQHGDVKVQIVTFAASANLKGSAWMTVAEAEKILDKLDAGGATDYDHALEIAAQSWGQPGKIPGGSNVTYFVSDGEPTGSDTINGVNNPNTISNSEAVAWQNHLNANGIHSQAIGLGGNLGGNSQLSLVAHNGNNPSQPDSENLHVVVNENDLPDILAKTVLQKVSGSLVDDGAGFGADGGYVSEVVIDGQVFTFDGTTITSSMSSSNVTYSTSGHILTVTVGGTSTLTINLLTGAYEFSGTPQAKPQTLTFDYTLKDNDGDTSSSQLIFDVPASKDNVDISSSGNMIDSVKVLGNDLSWMGSPATVNSPPGFNKIVDVDLNNGVSIDVGDAGDAVWTGSGDDIIYLGDSHAELDVNTGQPANQQAIDEFIQDTFTSGADSSILLNPSEGEDSEIAATQSSTANLDVAHGGGGDDYIFGEGGSDVIFGGSGNDQLNGGDGTDGLRGGTGDDTLKGGAGDDVLIGGLGDDILTGGSDEDIFKFVDQDASNNSVDIRDGERDVITDFTKGEDMIDISELLHTGANDTIDSLLQAHKIDLTLEGGDNLATADLKLTITDGNSSQEVIIQDVGSQFSDYISNGSITNVSGLLNNILSIYDTNS